MRLFLIVVFLLFFSASTFSADSVGMLKVLISKIDVQAGGVLRVALFRGEQGWPKFNGAEQVIQVVPEKENQTLVFEQVPYADDYAVEIHHDQNGNGKFDMRWFPYPRPKEGVGVSNNTFGFGHPDFSEAQFSFQEAEETLQIEMRYW